MDTSKQQKSGVRHARREREREEHRKSTLRDTAHAFEEQEVNEKEGT